MDQGQSSSNVPVSPLSPDDDDEGVSRANHLAWCKQRALELCDAGDPQQAFTSMVSDMKKHEATAKHDGILLGAMLMMSGRLEQNEVRNWITGFN